MPKPRFTPQGICALLICVTLSGCSIFSQQPPKPIQAKTLFEQGELHKAITLYDAHLNSRLSNPARPKGENPYFYCALIGDALLRAGDLQAAYRTYQFGRAAGIEDRMLAMRFRDIAHKLSLYPGSGHQMAIDFLQKYRDLDQLMIDLDIDVYHRAQIAAEDQQMAEAPALLPLPPTTLWVHRILPIRSLCEYKFFHDVKN